LRLSLVSVPVQAINAAVSGGGEIHFNQLHAVDHARIKYQKVCPVHGEVANDEIVSGYEYAKGQYVVVDREELNKLRGDGDKVINIDTFIEPDLIDPIYMDGRDYYLIPDTPVGQKSYAVLYEAMKRRNRCGVAQVVFSGKEELVLVRPLEGVLVMSMLRYDATVRKPNAISGDVPKVELSAQELKLAETLIDASTSEEFDYSRYEDLYTKRLTELIEAKVAGKELVTPPAEEEPQVINLMDALTKSVAQAKGKTKPAAKQAKTATRPQKKMAPSRQPAAARRRKSS